MHRISRATDTEIRPATDDTVEIRIYGRSRHQLEEDSMKESGLSIDRVGAVAGIASVVLLFALFMVFPSIPAPSKSPEDIATSAAANRGSFLFAAYVGALLSGALIVFGAAVAARIRRSESTAGGWWIVALAGIIAAGAIGFVSDALVIVLVRAVGHGVSGDVLWIGYGGDHWIGTLTGVPLGVFLLGAALGSRGSRQLPAWLAWSAIFLAAAFAAGAGSVTGDEVDGGPLGMLLFVAYLGLLVWIVGVSVVLWRRPALIRVEAAPSLA
jgi:hypothetical protein